MRHVPLSVMSFIVGTENQPMPNYKPLCHGVTMPCMSDRALTFLGFVCIEIGVLIWLVVR